MVAPVYKRIRNNRKKRRQRADPQKKYVQRPIIPGH